MNHSSPYNQHPHHQPNHPGVAPMPIVQQPEFLGNNEHTMRVPIDRHLGRVGLVNAFPTGHVDKKGRPVMIHAFKNEQGQDVVVKRFEQGRRPDGVPVVENLEVPAAPHEQAIINEAQNDVLKAHQGTVNRHKARQMAFDARMNRQAARGVGYGAAVQNVPAFGNQPPQVFGGQHSGGFDPYRPSQAQQGDAIQPGGYGFQTNDDPYRVEGIGPQGVTATQEFKANEARQESGYWTGGRRATPEVEDDYWDPNLGLSSSASQIAAQRRAESKLKPIEADAGNTPWTRNEESVTSKPSAESAPKDDSFEDKEYGVDPRTKPAPRKAEATEPGQKAAKPEQKTPGNKVGAVAAAEAAQKTGQVDEVLQPEDGTKHEGKTKEVRWAQMSPTRRKDKTYHEPTFGTNQGSGSVYPTGNDG